MDFEESSERALDAVQRRLRRLILGGLSTLPPGAATQIATEARRLRILMLPTAANLLERVFATAAQGESAFFEAVLHSAVYYADATRVLEQAAWEA